MFWEGWSLCCEFFSPVFFFSAYALIWSSLKTSGAVQLIPKPFLEFSSNSITLFFEDSGSLKIRSMYHSHLFSTCLKTKCQFELTEKGFYEIENFEISMGVRVVYTLHVLYLLLLLLLLFFCTKSSQNAIKTWVTSFPLFTGNQSSL